MAIAKLMESAGGKVESFYFAFGATDAFVIVELPDNISAGGVAAAVAASGELEQPSRSRAAIAIPRVAGRSLRPSTEVDRSGTGPVQVT